jgi:hypothetical protein
LGKTNIKGITLIPIKHVETNYHPSIERYLGDRLRQVMKLIDLYWVV